MIASMSITKEDLYKAMGEAKEGEAVELLTLPEGAEIISMSDEKEIEKTGKLSIAYKTKEEVKPIIGILDNAS